MEGKSSLDKEIDEMEILINLQMRKLELLREKNASLTQRTSDQSRSLASTGSDTGNPMKPGRIEMIEKSSKKDAESSSYGDSSAMQRLSCVSSNLANERTLLAFIRTALAIGRTMVAFMGLTSFSHYGHFMLSFAPMSFSVIAVTCLAIGIFRYFVIKDLINNLNVVEMMPRITSNYIVPTGCILILTMAMVATLANEWEKQKGGLEY